MKVQSTYDSYVFFCYLLSVNDGNYGHFPRQEQHKGPEELAKMSDKPSCCRLICLEYLRLKKYCPGLE